MSGRVEVGVYDKLTGTRLERNEFGETTISLPELIVESN